jgi:hypothetical protein
MAAPTTTDIKKLDYYYQGQPFCQIANQDTTGLDFYYQGQPFFATYTSGGTTTHIKSWNGVLYANMKNVNGVAMAYVKSINGLE